MNMVVATLYSTDTSIRHACCCCSSIQWIIQTGVLAITMLFNFDMGALLHELEAYEPTCTPLAMPLLG